VNEAPDATHGENQAVRSLAGETRVLRTRCGEETTTSKPLCQRPWLAGCWMAVRGEGTPRVAPYRTEMVSGKGQSGRASTGCAG